RHLVREADGAPRVADEQVERAAADRLRQGLGAEGCRADRVGLGDDVRAAILVAGDRQRQTKGEQQRHEAEQRGLQNPERLFEALREVPNAGAQEDPEPRRAEDHREEEQAQFEAGEPKEDHALGEPASSQGGSTPPATFASCFKRSSVRSIATGFREPTPPWNGLSRNQSSSSSDETRTATPPIIVACTNARSPLSAKKSMNTNRIAALRKSAIQSGVGMTPSPPCARSPRASSRSDRSSRYFENAACSDAERGLVACRLRNRASPQGFGASPSVPDFIRGHSRCTTLRA